MDNTSIYINGDKCNDIVSLYYANEETHALYYTSRKNIIKKIGNDFKIQNLDNEIFLFNGIVRYQEILYLFDGILYHGKITFDKIQVIGNFEILNINKMIGKIKNDK